MVLVSNKFSHTLTLKTSYKYLTNESIYCLEPIALIFQAFKIEKRKSRFRLEGFAAKCYRSIIH